MGLSSEALSLIMATPLFYQVILDLNNIGKFIFRDTITAMCMISYNIVNDD